MLALNGADPLNGPRQWGSLLFCLVIVLSLQRAEGSTEETGSSYTKVRILPQRPDPATACSAAPGAAAGRAPPRSAAPNATRYPWPPPSRGRSSASPHPAARRGSVRPHARSALAAVAARRACASVAQQAGHPLAHEPLLPTPHTGLGDPGAAHDLRRATAFRRRQDDPRPPDMLLWAVAIRHNRRQSLAVRGPHLDADPLAHPLS